ncbi:transmembrane protein 230-like [Phlebotomus argentipes]|uniref:transmembrane protein 230-like n=1 Tax=Phlebotomus argentipes TaxID=94469 RepID=UPI002892C526|nr:transmembrane protein 230-like [Phlebotomus argentipes]XP_059618998.1 transmembrane protein 230-like [Phlebotomus argentipes]
MSRRRLGHEYRRVPREEDTSRDAVDGFTEAQFVMPPPKIPWKAIIFSTFLCITGAISLAFGFLIAIGQIHEKYLDRQLPLFILGSIMFIPGSYHVVVAFRAFRNHPGYSFEDIPDFD